MFGVCSECYLSYGNIHVDILTRGVRYYGEDDDNYAIKNYKRTLDLETAIAKTEYLLGGNRIRKEVFTSIKDD